MSKFIPTTKEKWVIDKLKREGWRVFRDDYSDIEIVLYRPFHPWEQFRLCGVPILYINHRKGIWLEFRNTNIDQERIHHHWYFDWPTLKNWEQINLACKYMRKLDVLTQSITIEEFCNNYCL